MQSNRTAPILSTVKAFWTPAPSLRPRQFTTVSNAMAAAPTSCTVVSCQVQDPIFAERHGDGCVGRRLGHPERRPAEEKTGERTEGFLEVVVLSSGPGEHRSQLGVGQGAGEGQQSARDPGSERQGRMRQRSRHEGGGSDGEPIRFFRVSWSRGRASPFRRGTP